MFTLLKKANIPFLAVRANGDEICRIARSDIPGEKIFSTRLGENSVVEFIDSTGHPHRHELGPKAGWFHFSARIHRNLACQIDCAVTQTPDYHPDMFARGEAVGIRFQPFFLKKAQVRNRKFLGRGLFARGLHYSGMVTRSDIALACECDHCGKSFRIHSFHTGFSHCGYFYSASGRYTLIIPNTISGCPGASSVPGSKELAALEAMLPTAPDGSTFSYLNPFRCPHCTQPYIDFAAYPEERRAEHYGNYFQAENLLRYEPVKK